MPKLVLFDIDGTLLISRGIGREAKRRAMLDHFGAVGDLDNNVFGGKTDWGILLELLSPMGKTSADIGREMPAYERTLARHMRAISGDYPVTALPHAAHVVARLRARGDVTLGLVTGNASLTAAIKLELAGYDPEDFLVGAYGSESPERDDLTRLALRRARSLTGCHFAGRQVIVVGDTPDDIQAARAIEALAVGIYSDYAPRDQLEAAMPDLLLDDMSAFLAAVPI